MAKLLNRSDLVLGAGGSNIWERIFLGVPSISIITAENQRQVTKDIDSLGLTNCLGQYEEVAINDLYLTLKSVSLGRDREKYVVMARKCLQFEIAKKNSLVQTLLTHDQ